MRARTTLAAAAVFAVGALFGWLAAGGRQTEHSLRLLSRVPTSRVGTATHVRMDEIAVVVTKVVASVGEK